MANDLYAILRGMIREEIDNTPGFREITSRSPLPASIDAEKAILGSILIDDKNLDQAEGLLPEEFSLTSHQIIFAHMLEMETIDAVTLPEKLGQKLVAEVGGYTYLAGLTEGVYRHMNISHYVCIVKEKAKLRRIWKACESAITACQEQVCSSGEIVQQLGINLKGIKGAKIESIQAENALPARASVR